jgi:hypothetical protein
MTKEGWTQRKFSKRAGISIQTLQRLRPVVCLREMSVKKAKMARSLSPPSGAPHRIGAVTDEERSRSKFD